MINYNAIDAWYCCDVRIVYKNRSSTSSKTHNFSIKQILNLKLIVRQTNRNVIYVCVVGIKRAEAGTVLYGFQQNNLLGDCDSTFETDDQ